MAVTVSGMSSEDWLHGMHSTRPRGLLLVVSSSPNPKQLVNERGWMLVTESGRNTNGSIEHPTNA